MPVDQRVRQLPLSTHELEPVRFELVATSITLVQSLSLCDEGADRVLEAFDATIAGPPGRGPRVSLASEFALRDEHAVHDELNRAGGQAGGVDGVVACEGADFEAVGGAS